MTFHVELRNDSNVTVSEIVVTAHDELAARNEAIAYVQANRLGLFTGRIIAAR